MSEQILGLVSNELHASLFDQCLVGCIIGTERTDNLDIVKFTRKTGIDAVEHLGKSHSVGVFRA